MFAAHENCSLTRALEMAVVDSQTWEVHALAEWGQLELQKAELKRMTGVPVAQTTE